MVRILGRENSVFNRFIAEIRDEQVQKDRMRFRRNLERIGEIFAYEISRTFQYNETEVTTPLGLATVPLPDQEPVVCTILRAGLPLHQGILNVFDHADSAFVSAYRNHQKGSDSFQIEVEYLSSPGLNDRVLIINDTMLATGASMLSVFRALKPLGKARQVHVVSAIASADGLAYLQQHLPSSVQYWFGALDEELTAQAYIVPGLGDAGDLAYGTKS